jgi:hypothetical protein
VLNRLDRSVARAKDDILAPLREPTIEGSRSIAASGDVITLGAAKAFGPPWLGLVPPVDIATLRAADELRKLQRTPSGSPYLQAAPGTNGGRPDVVDIAVDRLGTVEKALGETERVIKRALTHARFGLGPISPNKLLLEPPKAGVGLEPPKAGVGLEPPKAGVGSEPPKAGVGDPGFVGREGSGDLRGDLALRRVSDLFRQVGETLMSLEEAATYVELTARNTLVVSPALVANPREAQAGSALAIEGAFLFLEEASANTRRTLRRVLAHPVYGLGPAEEPLSFDVRQDLAASGGLSRRYLRLL